MADVELGRLMRTSSSVNESYKDWRAEKLKTEERSIANLKDALKQKDPVRFDAVLAEELFSLEKMYAQMPEIGGSSNGNVSTDKMVLKNRKLRFFFKDLCGGAMNTPMIGIFLKYLPFANEPLIESKNQHPVHLAINNQAFDNVIELLKVDSLDVNAQWKKQTPLLMLFNVVNRENYDQVWNVVNRLAERQADINLGYFKEHPLSVLCKCTSIEVEQKHNLLMFCLGKFDADVDSFYDGQARKDIEELCKNNQIELPKKRAQVTSGLLQSLLHEKNEEKFLKAFNEFYVDLSTHGEDVYRLLKQAAMKGRAKCVKEIFAKTSSPAQPFTPSRYPTLLDGVLKMLCTKGFPQVLDSFLKNIKDVKFLNEDALLMVCTRNLKKKRTDDLVRCFDLLVNDPKINVEKSDHLGQTALHNAVQHSMEVEALKIMTQRSPYLGQLNRLNISPLHSMSAKVLESYLDSRISLDQSDDINGGIDLDMQGFLPPEIKEFTKKHYKNQRRRRPSSKEQSNEKRKVKRTDLLDPEQLSRRVSNEISPFRYIAHSTELRPLLRHPTINTFLLVKWLQLRWMIYAKLSLCVLFTLLFTIYATLSDKQSIGAWILGVCNLILAFCQLVLQGIVSPNRGLQIISLSHVKSWRNWLTIIIAISALFGSFSTMKVLLSFMVLLAGIDVVIHIGSLPFPALSTSIVMLETVSINFLKSLLVYVIILVAFGMSFFILFADGDAVEASQVTGNETQQVEEDELSFAELGSALLKTIVMFTGELDAGSIKFSTERASYLIFLGFLFLVSMVLANLMNGLAVSDISVIRQEAEVVALVKKIDDLTRYENDDHSYKPFKAQLSFFSTYRPKVIIRPRKGNKIVVLPVAPGSCDASEHGFPKWPFPAWLRIGCDSYHTLDSEIASAARDIVLIKSSRSEGFEKRLARLEDKIDRMISFMMPDSKKQRPEQIAAQRWNRAINSLKSIQTLDNQKISASCATK